ncbi:MAG TPA: ribonuclease HII [Candidatus Eisenbacteria bacterium]|nr:ribonuclease HII [Candidatus Eisenbacteria bacterium]
MTKKYIFRLSERDYSRFDEMNQYENEYINQGYQLIAGVDEAGRGPLAGPVAAAACILDPKKPIYGLNDSKKLTEKRRRHLSKIIKKNALAYKVVLIHADDIVDNNILGATKHAMTQAILGLNVKPEIAFIDAVHLEDQRLPAQRNLIHGDAVSNSIAAASILAKVSRDNFMIEQAKRYPEYAFDQHKGYATAAHYQAIKEHGLTPIHRLNFLHKLKLGSNSTSAIGSKAEREIENNLAEKGYLLLEKNFWLRPFGEIDLIMQKNKRIIFVEVKARGSHGFVDSAIDSLNMTKKMKIKRLAEYYTLSRKIESDEMLFILAACQLDPKHQIKNIKYFNF